MIEIFSSAAAYSSLRRNHHILEDFNIIMNKPNQISIFEEEKSNDVTERRENDVMLLKPSLRQSIRSFQSDCCVCHNMTAPPKYPRRPRSNSIDSNYRNDVVEDKWNDTRCLVNYTKTESSLTSKTTMSCKKNSAVDASLRTTICCHPSQHRFIGMIITVYHRDNK